MDYNVDEAEVLHFQITRLITGLFKTYLNLTEDINENHCQMMEKIEKISSCLDKEKIDLVDYFDESKYNFIRKKILDAGNDAIREAKLAIEKYDVKFKKK